MADYLVYMMVGLKVDCLARSMADHLVDEMVVPMADLKEYLMADY